ncbi:hypothetical protein D3C85_1396770 [compost metagenome]
MARNTGLLRRYREVRLVSMISFHSSSFIRINRLSRVIPALLIRMSMSPKRALMAAKTVSMDSWLVTFSAMPQPCSPR